MQPPSAQPPTKQKQWRLAFKKYLLNAFFETDPANYGR